MSDPRIVSVAGLRVWDSRGRPTVEARVTLADGSTGVAIAPAGASTGSMEAVDRRDGGKPFGGLDVRGAVASVNTEIAAAMVGLDVTDQARVDATLIALDGTPDKRRLGANATVAVSMAALHAAAASAKLPLWRYLADDRPVRLPLPEIQIFGGGAHARRRVDIQDFMVVCPAAASFAEALDWTAEIYHSAAAAMAARGGRGGVADEGGVWPDFRSNEEGLELLVGAIEAAGLAPGTQAAISLDVAASEFGADGQYTMALDGRTMDSSELAEMLARWLADYPIVSIEDPFAEDDGKAFAAFHAAHGGDCQIVGDDLLATDADRVTEAAAAGQVNAVLLKPNQVGTVSEARATLEAARRAGLGTIVSARSGETEDVTVAHLAVGWDAGQLKVGSFSRSERMVKWNACLRIEAELGKHARFAGAEPLKRTPG